MILVDSSVWVEYDRATGSDAHQRLRSLIAEDGPIAVTEPVVMEVCAGARADKRQAQLRALLLRFELLSLEPTADFDHAALIYRRCRAAGVTPRGLLDCLIAAVAVRNGATLLVADADLVRVAEVIGIHLDR